MAETDLVYRFIGEDVNVSGLLDALSETLAELSAVLHTGAERVRAAAAKPITVDLDMLVSRAVTHACWLWRELHQEAAK